MIRRQVLNWMIFGLALGGLAACGRRGTPHKPADGTYPLQYPYVAPEEKDTDADKVAGEKIENTKKTPKHMRLDPINRQTN